MTTRMTATDAQRAVNAMRQHGVRLSPQGQHRLFVFLALGPDTHAVRLAADDPNYGVFGIRSACITEAKLMFYTMALGVGDPANWQITAA